MSFLVCLYRTRKCLNCYTTSFIYYISFVVDSLIVITIQILPMNFPTSLVLFKHVSSHPLRSIYLNISCRRNSSSVKSTLVFESFLHQPLLNRLTVRLLNVHSSYRTRSIFRGPSGHTGLTPPFLSSYSTRNSLPVRSGTPESSVLLLKLTRSRTLSFVNLS